MVSKRFLLIALALATVILITSQIAAANELASNHDGEVEDAKYDHHDDDHGHHNSGHRHHHNGGRRYGRGHCRYGCCGGGGYYDGHGGGGGGCTTCCSTFAEATAYKQAHETQTHN